MISRRLKRAIHPLFILHFPLSERVLNPDKYDQGTNIIRIGGSSTMGERMYLGEKSTVF
jgi:hypothetical protein